MFLFHRSSVVSSTAAASVIPALFTTMSSPPKDVTASLVASITDCSLVTSMTTPFTLSLP